MGRPRCGLDKHPAGDPVDTDLKHWLERIAYHEAGHAIMAVHERLGLRLVSIVPNPGRLEFGHTQTSMPGAVRQKYFDGCGLDREWATRSIREAYGGLEGEEILRAVRGILPGPDPSYDHDLDVIGEMLLAADLMGDEHEHLTDDLRAETRSILRANEPAVHAVARALLTSWRVSGREVRRLMREATGGVL